MARHCTCRDCIGRDRDLVEAKRAINTALEAESAAAAESSVAEAIDCLEAYADASDQDAG